MFREVAVEGTLRDGTEPASGRTSRQRRQQNKGSAGRQAGVSEEQEQGGGGTVTASEERGMGPWGPGRGYSGHGRRAAGEWRQSEKGGQERLQHLCSKPFPSRDEGSLLPPRAGTVAGAQGPGQVGIGPMPQSQSRFHHPNVGTGSQSWLSLLVAEDPQLTSQALVDGRGGRLGDPNTGTGPGAGKESGWEEAWTRARPRPEREREKTTTATLNY